MVAIVWHLLDGPSMTWYGHVEVPGTGGQVHPVASGYRCPMMRRGPRNWGSYLVEGFKYFLKRPLALYNPEEPSRTHVDIRGKPLRIPVEDLTLAGFLTSLA